jgi:putative spermidine/putrescine transport system ATP-binding protein/spermidine/putrescine transport system ATP-binding protein
MVIKPSVLLLDEPLSALDRRLRQEMQVELLRIQRETGLTTIFVTHDQEEALTLSDQVAILDRGKIVQIGAPAEVYERPKTKFAAQFLGDSNFLSGNAVAEGIRLADGTLVRCNGTSLAARTRTVAIRPEKMSVLPAGQEPQPNANTLRARVDTVIYAGPALTYVLTTSDGTALKLFAQNRDGTVLANGSDITLTWSADHTIPVEE